MFLCLKNRLGETRSHLEKQTVEGDGAKRQIEELQQQIEQLKTQVIDISLSFCLSHSLSLSLLSTLSYDSGN